jgi:hypothetical protein
VGKPAADKAKLVKQQIAEAAERALKEAEERRRKAGAAKALPAERGGRKGPEPTRYGDWEKKGLISDF